MPLGRFDDMNVSLSGLQDEVNRLLNRVWHAGLSTGPFDGQEYAPLIDIYEHLDHFTVHVELPGVDPNQVEVSVLGGSLTICGEKVRTEEEGEAHRALKRERRFGSFARVVELPSGTEADGLKAKCNGGVLEITIPKSQASRPKSIKIDVQDE